MAKEKTRAIIILLVLIVFITSVFDANAKRRRSYNPKKTKNMAMETLESSDELSKIVANEFSEFQGDSMELDEMEGEDINELELEDDIVFNIDQLTDIYLAFVEGYDDNMLTASGLSKKELLDNITDWLGTPYRFGGTTRKAIDCSAFVLTMYKNTGNINLPRTARAQYSYIDAKVKFEDLQFGDLVFFHTRRHARVSHVGIYLGDYLFAHASSKYGVTISSMESNYYSKRFIGGRRITSNEIDDLSRK